MQLPISNQ